MEILTIKDILDELDLPARKSHFCSEQYQFLSLKLFPFSFFNPSETSGNVNSSLKSLASREFGSFYYMWDHYRPVQIRSIKNWRFWEPYHLIETLWFIKENKLYQNNLAPFYGSENLQFFDWPNLNRSVVVSHIAKTTELSTSERFETWIYIPRSFGRIEK